MFLFDTDTITNIVKPRPSQNLLQKLEKIPKNQQYVSTITISEIVYGAEKSQRSEFHLNNLETIFRHLDSDETNLRPFPNFLRMKSAHKLSADRFLDN